MKIIDANKEKIISYNFDIAIIGAGIIGVFLAFLLKKTKYKVILIDRGNKKFNYSKEVRTINKGTYHASSQTSKALMLGGKSSLWGGQLSEFRKEDIKKNFWGLQYNELKKLYNSLYKTFHLKCNNKILYNKKFKLGFYFTYFLKKPNLFQYFKTKILNSKNILIISNLVAQELVFENKKVKFLKCKNNKNNLINIKSKKFILCLGTIENIRFFLTNKALSRNNPLKKLKFIGHFFQDHLAITFGKLTIKSKAKFSNLFENRLMNDIIHQPKICNVLNNKNQLSMTASFICQSYENKLVYRAKKNLIDFKKNLNIKNFIRLLNFKYFKYVILYIFHYIVFKRIRLFFGNTIKMNIVSEQSPLSDSKITINNKKLKDGLNQAILNWKIDIKQLDQIKNFIKKLVLFINQSRIGQLEINKDILIYDKFIKNITDTNHASGGLKISKNSKKGVCDKNFKVWGTSNLFVAGSALFPNSGHSNVTLTAMALTLKLSKHILKKK
jgi:hypothetical protein